LVAVLRAHRFQVSRACLSTPTWSRSLLSLRSFQTCRQLQPPTSSFIVVTNVMNSRRLPCLCNGRKPSLEHSTVRHRCFLESTWNLPVL